MTTFSTLSAFSANSHRTTSLPVSPVAPNTKARILMFNCGGQKLE